MATTDQLRKAERRSGLQLNSWSRDAYVKALEEAGHTGVRSLSKTELFLLVKAERIVMVPSWHH